MELLFATNNPHKLQEVRAMLPQGITVKGLAEAGFDEDIPETGDTLIENALIKARFLASRTGRPAFADDTGLEVAALDGAPGVHSARYAGDDKDSEANTRLLLANMAQAGDRRARFRTVIALVTPGHEYLFEGKIEGEITREPAGEGGFGYDPVFRPAGQPLTFAQMTAQEKNHLSHRYEATRRLVDFVKATPELR